MRAANLIDAAFGARPPVFRTTSDRMSVLKPPVINAPWIDLNTKRRVRGTPLGYFGRINSGGFGFSKTVFEKNEEHSWTRGRVAEFDPFAFLRGGLTFGLNVLISGDIGYGKSGWGKAYVARSIPLGRKHLVLDCKQHEYGLLVRYLNSLVPAGLPPIARVIRFGRDSNTFINLVDPDMSRPVKESLLQLVFLHIIEDSEVKDLTIEQREIISDAIASCERYYADTRNVPIMEDFAYFLEHLSPGLLYEFKKLSEEKLDEYVRPLRIAAYRLTKGSLKGMFNQRTTPGILEPLPLLVLDSAGVKDPVITKIMTELMNHYTFDVKGRFDVVISDETWKSVLDEGFIAHTREGQKTGRTHGTSYWVIGHSLASIMRSTKSSAIADMGPDSQVKVSFHSNLDDQQASAEILGQTELEMRIIANLREREAYVKVGEYPGRVMWVSGWEEEHQAKIYENSQKAKGEHDPTDDFYPDDETDTYQQLALNLDA